MTVVSQSIAIGLEILSPRITFSPEFAGKISFFHDVFHLVDFLIPLRFAYCNHEKPTIIILECVKVGWVDFCYSCGFVLSNCFDAPQERVGPARGLASLKKVTK
jgi:hypothetical protein